jgi:hypothetical protein
MKRLCLISAAIVLAAAGMRLFIALRWPNDQSDDGRGYALLAKNVLDHHAYSIDPEPPVSATYVRVPGYPLFLAAVYKVFGPGNNGAVRAIQVVASAATCLIVALLAYAWAPVDWGVNKKRGAFLFALGLSAACPATAFYVACILTETWAIFFITLSVLAGTYAIKTTSRLRACAWWAGSGVSGGIATMIRPDSAIFVGAIGTLLVMLWGGQAIGRALRQERTERAVRAARQSATIVMIEGMALFVGFAAALGPWTVRNARVFHVFQPIAPEDACMPGVFCYPGYISWLRTWLDDQVELEIAEWRLDIEKIHVAQLPDSAFDSPEERDKISQLFDAYNKEPAGTEARTPRLSDGARNNPPEGTAKLADAALQSTDAIHLGPKADVQMTPQLDAEFGQIASERNAGHPFRHYVSLPWHRAFSMWFDTYFQYYRFRGDLFPLSKLAGLREMIFRPLYLLAILIYTGIGLGGTVVMWLNKDSRRWALLLLLLIVPRLAFLSMLENAQPRYVVEFFPFVVAAGALGIAAANLRQPRQSVRWERQAANAVSG